MIAATSSLNECGNIITEWQWQHYHWMIVATSLLKDCGNIITKRLWKHHHWMIAETSSLNDCGNIITGWLWQHHHWMTAAKSSLNDCSKIITEWLWQQHQKMIVATSSPNDCSYCQWTDMIQGVEGDEGKWYKKWEGWGWGIKPHPHLSLGKTWLPHHGAWALVGDGRGRWVWSFPIGHFSIGSRDTLGLYALHARIWNWCLQRKWVTYFTCNAQSTNQGVNSAQLMPHIEQGSQQRPDWPEINISWRASKIIQDAVISSL